MSRCRRIIKQAEERKKQEDPSSPYLGSSLFGCPPVRMETHSLMGVSSVPEGGFR
jgi:hypothetical protein